MKNTNRQWHWEEDSVLNRIGPYTDTKVIFDATCREVNRYYSTKPGFKTFKRKIQWKGTYINCMILFNTAHWNTSGRAVCFDPCTVIYANDITDMLRKGSFDKYKEK